MHAESDITHVEFVKSRRAGREAAFQALYEIEIGQIEIEEALEDIFSRVQYSPGLKLFIRKCVEGTEGELDTLDDLIIPLLAKGWEYSRIATTDRCLLRLATFELLFLPEMPPKVTIGEAVRLAKKFGSPESGRFVNGLLGSLLKQTDKAVWDPKNAEVHIEEDLEPESQSSVAQEPIVEEEIIHEGSGEHEALKDSMRWTIKVKQDN